MTRSRPIVRITTNQLSARRDVISTLFLGKSVRTEAIRTPTSRAIGMHAASVWFCRSIERPAPWRLPPFTEEALITPIVDLSYCALSL